MSFTKTFISFSRLISFQNRVTFANCRYLCAAKRANFFAESAAFRNQCGHSLTGYNHAQKRFVKKIQQTSEPPSDSDEEKEKEPENVEVVKDYKDQNVFVSNPRVDNVLRKAAGMTRNKIESMFYESRIYVNDQRLTKKSLEIHEDDVVDLIIGLNKDYREMLDVMRMVVLYVSDVPDENDKYQVKVRKFSKLIIENYEDPWKAVSN